MTPTEYFESQITEDNCSWSEYEQCNNHKWAITQLMEEYAKIKVEEVSGALFDAVRVDYAKIEDESELYMSDLKESNSMHEQLEGFYDNYLAFKNNSK